MPKLPRLRGKELIAVLRQAGFDIIRIKGSHHFLRHADGRATVVPVHTGDIIGPGLLKKILHDVEWEVEDLISRIR